MPNNNTFNSSATNNGTLGDSHASVIGWMSGPDGRGTMDIIWGSFLTIFLCTWTAVCLNLPSPKDKQWQIFRRKAKWMFWAIVGPEFVLTVAIGQYASARRSVKRVHKLGFKQWTLRHAFFADMGGIILKPKDGTPFVINARQLAYLVQKDYLAMPTITEEEIWDKSKADTLSKVLTLSQASWLTIQLLGRAILRLPTTTLELSAAAIVFCTFGTFICWLRKPSDVKNGIVVTTNVTIDDILKEAGDLAAEPYKHTPLDFVAKQHFTIGFEVMGALGLRCDDRQRPLQRFPNDRFPDINTFEKFSLFCWTTAYAALHLVGWNFEFPTRVEALLWKVSSLVITGVTVIFWVVETIAARQRFGRWDKYLIWLGLKKPISSSNINIETQEDEESSTEIVSHSAEQKIKPIVHQDTIVRLDDFEVQQRKAYPMRAWELALMSPIVPLYAAARGYMMIEVFLSLRQLPLGVFKTFNVAQILPHW